MPITTAVDDQGQRVTVHDTPPDAKRPQAVDGKQDDDA